MKQQKFLIITIVLLILLNLGILGFLFFNTPNPSIPQPGAEMGHRPGNGSNPPSISLKLKEPLLLNDAQIKQIDSIHFAHVKKMRNIDEHFKNNMEKYFALLTVNSYSEKEKDSLQKELVQIHTRKIEESFSNFENIKRVLTPDQQQIFIEMLPEITDRKRPEEASPFPPHKPIPPHKN